MIFGGVEQKGPKRGIKHGLPIAVAADVALLEGRDKVENRVTALLQSIEGVLEGFYPIHAGPALRGSEQVLARADRAEASTIELEASLPHPLKDNVVISERALVRRNAAQPHQGEQDV